MMPGTRERTNTEPSRKKIDSVATYGSPVSVPATCQTSALMNRNVVNSNNNGSARTTRLASALS